MKLSFLLLLTFLTTALYGQSTIDTNSENKFLTIEHKKQKSEEDYLFIIKLIMNNNDTFFGEHLSDYIGEAADSQKIDFYNILIYSKCNNKMLDEIVNELCDYYYAGGTSKYTKKAIKERLDKIFYFENKTPALKKSIERMKDEIVQCYFTTSGSGEPNTIK